jgi:hypothetical protein
MHDSRQRTFRLVGAIEDLVAQEALALRAGEFTLAGELAGRVAPLISDLAANPAAHAVLRGDRDLQGRMRAVQTMRRHSGEWLEGELQRVGAGLHETSAAQGRVARFAPVYGGAPAVPLRRLDCVG